MFDLTDTIAAIATPLGESGIGVIRLSGTEAYAIGDKIFQSTAQTPLAQRRATFNTGRLSMKAAKPSMKYCFSS